MLSVIIPVRNERDTIAQAIERVRAVDVGMAKQIIVVDGASTDGTGERLRSLLVDDMTVIWEEAARGKGLAVRAGLAEAKGEVVVIQDADLELDPGAFPSLLEPIISGRADAALGVRFATGRGATPWPGYLGNRALSLLASLLFLRRLNDILTAYKMMRTAVARALPLTCRGFDLDAELACRLVRGGYRIVQVPVEYRPRSRDEGKKLGFSAGWSVLKAILRVRFEGRPPAVEPSLAESAGPPPVERGP
jgi:glycosyltransferase involved in cell wall biosynthesis